MGVCSTGVVVESAVVVISFCSTAVSVSGIAAESTLTGAGSGIVAESTATGAGSGIAAESTATGAGSKIAAESTATGAGSGIAARSTATGAGSGIAAAATGGATVLVIVFCLRGKGVALMTLGPFGVI